ncbi:MAG: cytochrome c3 family protein [Anaerolineales bacterium]
MNRRRLGCLTTGGLIALIIALVVAGASFAFSGYKMFSPGELNAQSTGLETGGVQSHADLSEDCAACHTAPWSAEKMTNRCLDCHQDVIEQLKDLSSLHGAVMAGFDSIDCKDCHTDHHGVDGKLTEILSMDFPHELVGFSLMAHRQIDWERDVVCQDCHQDSFRDFEQIACQNCHEQVDASFMSEHNDMFGLNCRACHDGIETLGKDFDHNKMTFPLEGKHANVSCEECHQGAVSLVDLKQVGTACENCHLKDDVHTGAMGTQCATCHTPVNWNETTFDHRITGFLLIGGHDGLACDNCHVDKTYQGANPACISCHAADEPHNGQFGTDCAACHVVTTWSDIHFTHNASFAQDCQSCHAVDKPANHYPGQCSACHSTNAWKPASFDHQVAGATDCQSCHAVDKPANHYSGQCSACHSTNAWKPASFNHQVAGATDCISCHSNKKPANHFSGQCSACHSTNAWKPASFNHKVAGATDCISCHSGNKPANHFSGQCSQCHSTNAWKPASFKHDFPLNHGGANSQCTLCHTNNNYNAYTCFGCHEHDPARMQDKHKEVSNYSNNCIQCHPGGREADD